MLEFTVFSFDPSSRGRKAVAALQLQAVAATSNFRSASPSSLSLRPCSTRSLNFGTQAMRFHSSALCLWNGNWLVLRLVVGATVKESERWRQCSSSRFLDYSYPLPS